LDKIEVGGKLVAIGAYVQMGNHFHVLAKEISKDGISTFMEKLSTGYSKYFNKKYERTGALFQGVFKAEHVSRDEYLKYLFAYIHLNPVKLIDPEWKENGIKDRESAKRYLEQYTYSSYLDHLGKKREEGLILTPKEFPEYFEDRTDFEQYINDWLMFKDEFAEEKRFEADIAQARTSHFLSDNLRDSVLGS
jgi:putative transposase